MQKINYTKNTQLPYNDYFRTNIYMSCKKVVEEYMMIQPGDRIAVEITYDCNTLTLLAFLLEYQKERDYDFSMEFFVESKNGEIENSAKKILNYVGITKYQTVESVHKEELYQYMKAANCNCMALHQNYNHIVKATLMSFMRNKKKTVISPVIELEKHEIKMIRPMFLLKDRYILHWINKIGVEIRLGDEITLFGGASLSEEGIGYKGLHSGAEFQFNVYEPA